jgi:polysaccharide deacetylase 2 family uncharacterized protein YibQ
MQPGPNPYAMKPSKRIQILALILILIGLFAVAYGIGYFMFGRSHKGLSLARTIDPVITNALADKNLSQQYDQKNLVIKDYGKSEWEKIEVIISVEEDASLAGLSDALRNALDSEGLNVVETTTETGPTLIEHQITVYSKDLPVYQVLFLKRRAAPPSATVPETAAPEVDDNRPKIAIVVDDAGYDLDRVLELLNLRRSITISIFPQLRYSRQIAEVAHDMGYEVMMHLPMDSGKNLRRNPGHITGEMSDEEMYRVIEEDLQSIPYVKGVNNHQGSMMTSDREAMVRVLNYLGEKKLFFIDSRTTSETVAYQTAKDLGVPTAENNVFLDNEKDVEYIKERILLLIEEAKQNGKSVGICHVHPETTKALYEMFPVIEQEGIKLVFASELTE